MKKRPKILILTAAYGNGHVQVANVLKDQFIQCSEADVIISSIYAESYPTLTPISENVYLKSYTPVGKPIYSLFYHGIAKVYDKRIAKWFVNLGRKRLAHLVETEQPDIIINTFPVLAVPELRRRTGSSIPTFSIITDYCLHKIWISPEIDRYFVATESIKESVCRLGIPPSNVKISGIPIRPSFEQPTNSSELFQKYGLNPHQKRILLMAGAFGVLKSMDKICETLLMENDCQLVVICGKNDKLKAELETLAVRFPDRLLVLGYVDRVDEWFRLASFLITKPGGITLTEAAAIGLPVILYKPTPGQEKGNAVYFERQNGALVARGLNDIYRFSSYLLENDEVLDNMKRSIHSIHRKQAAQNITEDILEAVHNQHHPLYRNASY
ncbi:processive 1,2-diacylglycerol beta-glucosyltransferase [Bacillus fengqiuensis]|nr:processive 1,2-diacylglycerol beta-glucosyltransferase [Bacillus fengqiuensis]